MRSRSNPALRGAMSTHVGTGFSHAMEETARQALETAYIVTEIRFTEWTSAGEMRHPAFLGLREDKKPMDVAFEKEARPPK